jgi:hypothetical protein
MFEILNRALPLAKQGGDLEQIATVYNNIGGISMIRKNISSHWTITCVPILM